MIGLGSLLVFLLVGMFLLGMAELLFYGLIIFIALSVFAANPNLLVILIILVILKKVL